MSALPNLCPACQAKLRIPDHFLGSRVKCPRCGKPFVVPAATLSEDEVVKLLLEGDNEAGRPGPVAAKIDPEEAAARLLLEEDNEGERPKSSKRKLAKKGSRTDELWAERMVKESNLRMEAKGKIDKAHEMLKRVDLALELRKAGKQTLELRKKAEFALQAGRNDDALRFLRLALLDCEALDDFE